MEPSDNTRREFIKKGALLAAAGMAAGSLTNISRATVVAEGDAFTLPPLPYKYEDLEPHIDAQTMQIHHDKHHGAYVTKLNDAIKAAALKETPSLENLLKDISKYAPAIRNNGGGHYNHTMFWNIMKPGGGGNPAGKLADAINASFGTVDDFKKKLNEAALSRFGSGWAWLIKKDGRLSIASTPNQDNPLMDVSDVKGFPVMGIDVWEHAYYLKYQNKRADYVNAWWNVINWDEVSKRFSSEK